MPLYVILQANHNRKSQGEIMVLKGSLQFQYGQDDCTFRTIHPEDVSQTYVDGLALENKYLSNIPTKLSIETQQQYISQIITSPRDTICGLFLGKKLVGTAGIQNLSAGNYAAVGIFLFGTSLRGKGFGKVMVWAASQLAFSQIQLAGTMGGMKQDNIASLKSFLACGGVSSFDANRGIHQVHISTTDFVTLPGLSEIQIIQ
jgi:RimJ/RimL family protein N-acetyltransferase